MVGQELWPYISPVILGAVEANYMQNDRADLSFRGRSISFLGAHQGGRGGITHFGILIHTFFRDTLYIIEHYGVPFLSRNHAYDH